MKSMSTTMSTSEDKPGSIAQQDTSEDISLLYIVKQPQVVVHHMQPAEALKLLEQQCLKTGSLNTTRLVASGKVLQHTIPTQNCDIIMTLPATTDDSTLMWLLARLRSRTPSILVHVRHWTNTGVYVFYMSAEYESLLHGAEQLCIMKPLKTVFGGGMKVFVFNEQHCYEGVEDEGTFLSSQERQSILYHMLLNLRATRGENLGKINFLEGQPIVPLLQSKKIISQVFPLHETEALQDLRNSWVQSLRFQPLEKVCTYYGVKIAMYFAYLGHYTTALIVPTLLGITFWFVQEKSQLIEDLCFMTFAIFNVFWATFYIAGWERRSSELAYRWGTLDQKHELLQDPRPLYQGDLVLSPVTGRMEPHYPAWKRNLFWYCVSIPIIAGCLLIIFCVMLIIFELQEWVNGLVKAEAIPGFCRLLPKILLAIVISIMDDVYRKIAVWLNDNENYRWQESYENHLIIKIAIFQFVNSFLSLFYIAFYLRDMDRLREQLAALLITRQVIGNIKEALVPYIMWKMRLMKVGYNITAHLSPRTLQREIRGMSYEVEGLKSEKVLYTSGSSPLDMPVSGVDSKTDQSDDSTDTVVPPITVTTDQSGERIESTETAEDQENESSGVRLRPRADPSGTRRRSVIGFDGSALTLTQAETESTMKTYEDTFDDYLEMFIQYGYVILFSSAFPLAALCALLNNLIEIRSDAFKLCFHHQRPFGNRVENIGTWLDALRVMGVIAVIVNTALIGVSGQVQRMKPDMDVTSVFILIIILEHIILVVKSCIAYAIPSRPYNILQEMARLEFLRREALKSLESSPHDSRSPPSFCSGPSSLQTTHSSLSALSTPPIVPARHHTSNLSSLGADILEPAEVDRKSNKSSPGKTSSSSSFKQESNLQSSFDNLLEQEGKHSNTLSSASKSDARSTGSNFIRQNMTANNQYENDKSIYKPLLTSQRKAPLRKSVTFSESSDSGSPTSDVSDPDQRQRFVAAQRISKPSIVQTTEPSVSHTREVSSAGQSREVISPRVVSSGARSEVRQRILQMSQNRTMESQGSMSKRTSDV